MSSTNQVELSYALEATPGVPDPTAERKRLRYTSESLESVHEFEERREVGDSQLEDLTLVQKMCGGDVVTEVIARNADDFLSNLFGVEWLDVISDEDDDYIAGYTGARLRVDEHGVFKFANTNATDLVSHLRIGDKIKFKEPDGEQIDYPANYGVKEVVSLHSDDTSFGAPYFVVKPGTFEDSGGTAFPVDVLSNAVAISGATSRFLLKPYSINRATVDSFEVPDWLTRSNSVVTLLDGFPATDRFGQNTSVFNTLKRGIRGTPSVGNNIITLSFLGTSGIDFVPLAAGTALAYPEAHFVNLQRLRPTDFVTDKSFTLKKVMEAGDHYYFGGRVESVDLRFAAGQKPSFSISFLCSRHTVSPTNLLNAQESKPSAGLDIVGPADFQSIRIVDLPRDAVVTSLECNLRRGISQGYGLGSLDPEAAARQILVVEGSLEVYFNDSDLYDNFRNNSQTDIFCYWGQNNQIYALVMPKVRITSASVVAGGGDRALIARFEFTCLKSQRVTSSIDIYRIKVL